MRYYIIDKATGARLCKDGMWRSFANFGTFKENVKSYNRKGWALRRIKAIGNGHILSLDKGWAMDACGNVWDENSNVSGVKDCREMIKRS